MSGFTETPKRPPEALYLTNWPLRDDGRRAWSMVLGLVIVACAAGAAGNSFLLGIATFLALALSVWRLWVPVTFHFSSRGVEQSCWNRRRRIPWPQIARYEVLSRGVLLSADRDAAPLSPLRGIYVAWNDQREELVKILEFFLGDNHRTEA